MKLDPVTEWELVQVLLGAASFLVVFGVDRLVRAVRRRRHPPSGSI